MKLKKSVFNGKKLFNIADKKILFAKNDINPLLVFVF